MEVRCEAKTASEYLHPCEESTMQTFMTLIRISVAKYHDDISYTEVRMALVKSGRIFMGYIPTMSDGDLEKYFIKEPVV